MIRKIVSWAAIVVLSFGMAACNRDKYETKVKTPSGEYKIRAPLKANADGSLVMASEVPAGASCAIMEGTKEGLLSAAESAARSAIANLGVARPAGVLSFDCICRRIFLDEFARWGKLVKETGARVD